MNTLAEFAQERTGPFYTSDLVMLVGGLEFLYSQLPYTRLVIYGAGITFASQFPRPLGDRSILSDLISTIDPSLAVKKVEAVDEQ